MPELTKSALTIGISLSLIEDLSLATIEALKSVPKRGLEIGGILLGRINIATSTIVIEDFEPLDSEHLHGPSWLLSPKDRSVLRQAVARLRDRPSPKPGPVGFYRSQTRDAALDFNDQDNVLVRETFSNQSAVSLLVRPSLAEPSVARLGIKAGDLLQPVAVFPFHAGVLRKDGFQIVEDLAAVTTTSGQPEPVDNPAPAATRIKRFPVIAALLAAAAAILLASFFFDWSRTARAPVRLPPVTAASLPAGKPQPAESTAVMLSVQRQEATAILSWNREALPVKNADYALLEIDDGGNRQVLRLGKTELEAGRVVYIPRNRDVGFQLQVFGPAGSATESIRSVAGPSPTQAQPTPKPARLAGDADEPVPPPTVRRFTESAAPVAPEPPIQANNPPPADESKPAPFPETRRAAQADKTPPKPRDTGVITTVSLELIGHSGFREVLGDLSPRRMFGFRSSDKSTPPRVVRKLLPAIYPALASAIHGSRQVDVKVTVGTAGQIVKAELVNGHATEPLNAAVLYVARQWTFEPARNGEKPVESKVLMHFLMKRAD